jgi:hypothetical protein
VPESPGLLAHGVLRRSAPGRSTRDREFVDKGDVSVPGNMQAFYRESLMSQANHRFHGETIRPGAYKLRVE